MRRLFLAAVMASAAMPVAMAPADAQYSSQREREPRPAQRDWRQYHRYDHNRYEPGAKAYYPDDYYRDGRYYRERQLSANDRIYRGRDNRYYCRRPDGTTGLIVGGAVGALLGNSIGGGGSSLLGTLVGGGAGALLGREVQRGGVRCR
jgi:hypothetical protein